MAARGAILSLRAALAGSVSRIRLPGRMHPDRLAPAERVDSPLAPRPSWSDLPVAVRLTSRPTPSRPRLALATTRAIGAQCPLCGGIGCIACAGSGLR